jgi:hypothetical protein
MLFSRIREVNPRLNAIVTLERSMERPDACAIAGEWPPGASMKPRCGAARKKLRDGWMKQTRKFLLLVQRSLVWSERSVRRRDATCTRRKGS